MDPHPNLYQLTHWWHWLAYGQNSAVIQALAALVATGAAIAAGIFAARAYSATVLQVGLAEEQLRLAREQFAAEVRHLEEERAANQRSAAVNFERTRAQEDSSRPRFRLSSGYKPYGGKQTLEFQNHGGSAAEDVRILSTATGELLGKAGHLDFGAKTSATVDPEELGSTGILVTFRTTFGSHWETVLVVRGISSEETVRNVTRLYSIPTVG